MNEPVPDDIPSRADLQSEIDNLREQHADDIERIAEFGDRFSRHREQVENLEIALSTARQIGAAMGVLIERHRCTKDEAFAILRRESQRTHRKLRDVADDLLQTGQLGVPPPAN